VRSPAEAIAELSGLLEAAELERARQFLDGK
jgi:hypothetical protein